MWKTKFLFRSEDEQFEAYVNPMHIRQAAAVALSQHGANFMEVADVKSGETLMVCVYREANPNGGFMYLFPDDEPKNVD